MSCAGCESCSFTDDTSDTFDPNNLPYELHITVAASSDIEKFKNDCAELKVKPVLINMQGKDGSSILDLMTSSTVKGTYQHALNTSFLLAADFAWMGYDVLRRKIETVPFHPEAMNLSENQYFECHLAVKCHRDDRETLSRISRGWGAHMSKNAFKVGLNGYDTIMVTLRDRTSYVEFLRRKLLITVALRGSRFEVDKTITEFAIFDDKISHDDAWIKPVG